MKITYYVASSLDGYIAKEDGDVSWLDDLGISPEEAGYDAFYSTADALVMGRRTYDMILKFGSWPYGKKPVWICTTRSIDVIEGCNLQTGKTPQNACSEARAQGIDHLWLVGGGRLASSFLEQKLLTHLSISLMPIILGEGISLFSNLPNPITIQRIRIQPNKSGLTQIDFLVNKLTT